MIPLREPEAEEDAVSWAHKCVAAALCRAPPRPARLAPAPPPLRANVLRAPTTHPLTPPSPLPPPHPAQPPLALGQDHVPHLSRAHH